ncbi:sce7726 family protein [Ulvibacterium marinum]|uniref:sce7726 family protein n=1 Tax=Ulvibacterium marinum TaxID=2419782 RepID=UPI0024955227|nr:sce7726 family protein [Ulvibacterium marinum]
MLEPILSHNNKSNSFSTTLRKYNALEYSSKLTSLLNKIYPKKDFTDYTKFDLHKIFNDLFINNYWSEEVLKFKLFDKLEDKKNFTGAFEIPVADSRVDFITINGRTTSYEIKSEFDNLSKLKKQVNDYSKAFEYNYVVLDVKHKRRAERIIPEYYGILTFRNGNLYQSRKALLNKNIQSKVQLSLLSKKELNKAFSSLNEQEILESFESKQINKIFKDILRNRYSKKWNFLLDNQHNILPIDIQFFFKTNINPLDIYYH